MIWCWWHWNLHYLSFQHTSNIVETKLGSKAFDLGGRQGFGKCISHYLSGRTIGESDPLIHQMKWKWISMCFKWAWYWQSLVRKMTDQLFKNRVVALLTPLKICPMKNLSQRASFMEWVATMYLLLVVNRNIISRLFILKDSPTINQEYIAQKSMSIFIHTSICISIHDQFFLNATKQQPQCDESINPLHSFLMSQPRVIWELGKSGDYMQDIGLST